MIHCCSIEKSIFSPFRFFLILVLATCSPVAAQELPVPVKLQTELFQIVLTFDRNHRPGAGQTATIAVVYQNSFRRSLECKNEVLAAFEGKKDMNIIPIDLENGFLQEIGKHPKPDMIIVGPLRSAELDEITTYSRKEHVLTATLVSQYIGNGISVCVHVERDMPVIVLNLPAARLEHADFDSRLLKFVRTFTP
jgi:hypothetical protein